MDSIQTLLNVRGVNPSLDARKIMDLIGEILYPKTDIDTGEPNGIPNNLNQVAVVRDGMDYSKMFELVGKRHPKSQKSDREGNPWGIQIGYLAKCPRCGKVGIEGIKLDGNKGANRTYLKHVIKHYAGNSHTFDLAKVDGMKTYEDMVKMKEDGKI